MTFSGSVWIDSVSLTTLIALETEEEDGRPKVDGEAGVRRERDTVARKGTRLLTGETWSMEWEAGM